MSDTGSRPRGQVERMRDHMRRGFQTPQNREGQHGGAREGQEPSGVPIVGMSQIRQMAKMEFSRAKRYGYPLTLAVCRIDRVESLADLYGQESRRLLMDRLASLFAHRARTTDIVGRLAEDRLLWVQTHTDLDGARIAADRIRLAVAGMEVQSGAKQIPVTLSLGLSCFSDGNTLFFDSILYQAEKALERAQGMGGNLCEEHPMPTKQMPRRPYLPGEGEAHGSEVYSDERQADTLAPTDSNVSGGSVSGGDVLDSDVLDSDVSDSDVSDSDVSDSDVSDGESTDWRSEDEERERE